MKKFLSMIIVLLIIGIATTPVCTTKSDYGENFTNLHRIGIFGLQGNINFSYNTEFYLEPIMPLTGEVVRFINISYKVSGLFAPLILRLLKVHLRSIGINLSVEEDHDYATIFVEPYIVTPGISFDWKSEMARIHISLDENAPAYKKCHFTLKAKSETYLGPFGFLTLIPDTEYFEEIPFVPGYLPIIDFTPETTYLETPPGEISNVTFFCQNLGNGLTKINSEIVEIPSDDWWIYIQPEIVLDVHESKNVSLFILPPLNFSGHDRIKLSITPSYYYDPTQQGTTYNMTITVHYRP